MQIWVFFDSILAKFVKAVFQIHETCIYLPQSFYKVILSLLSPFVRDIRISTFLAQPGSKG